MVDGVEGNRHCMKDVVVSDGHIRGSPISDDDSFKIYLAGPTCWECWKVTAAWKRARRHRRCEDLRYEPRSPSENVAKSKQMAKAPPGNVRLQPRLICTRPGFGESLTDLALAKAGDPKDKLVDTGP